MIKRLVWSFIALLILVAGGIIYFGAQKQSADDTVTVTRDFIERVARGNGRIEGISEPTPLSFGQPGQVEIIDKKVVEGQEVEFGDELARMNPAELDVRIAEADAVLKIAQAKAELAKLGRTPESIKQAEERVTQASEKIKAAQIKLKFLQEPSQPLPAPAHEIAEADRNIQKATAKLKLEQQALEKLKAGPTPIDISVMDAQVNLADVTFKNAEKAFKEAVGNKPKLEGEMEQARKKLQVAEAERDRMKQGPSKHEIESAEQRIKLAQTEVDGAEAAKNLLVKPPAPQPASEQSIAEAKIALLDAQANERAAKAAVDDLKRGPLKEEATAADAAVEQAEKSKKLLELRREGLRLRAPFAGRIIKVHVQPGSLVNGFQPVVTMIDFSSKMLRTEFDIGRLSEIKQGMKVVLSSKALKEPLDGKVEKIVGVGTRKIFADDPGAPKGGEVVEVLIKVENPTGELKKSSYDLLLPGLRMDAAVALERRDAVLRVPKGFVSNDGKEYVWVKASTASAEAIRHNVKCGLRDESYVEITEGLSEGDVLVKPKPVSQR